MVPRAIRSVLATACLVALMLPWAGPAQAGGGCHAGMTQGQGDMVEMVEACFTPSIVRISPGDELTFVNQDLITHNVSANGWGRYDDMMRGDAFTARFAEPGVYPFACTYHPAMVGAVVVGDGTGPGSGEQVTMAASDSGSDGSGTAPARVQPTSADGGAGLGWGVAAVLGAALGGGIGFLGGRRRAAVR
jgi:plastocyanin